VRLKDSLDKIYSTKYSNEFLKDAVESKLFGIGSESYVVGSHEFYMGYALTNGIMLCLDLGHFHPTEAISDKISSMLLYSDEVLLHVSRGVRWDSDHVVIWDDALAGVTREAVRCGLDKVHVALDYFDGTLNRVGAWVTGSRATLKSLLSAMLEPTATLTAYEESGKLFQRLAFMEELKSMPAGDVWNYFCMKMGVPAGHAWISDVEEYENTVTAKR
jgi:L-rhamnose isomerase